MLGRSLSSLFLHIARTASITVGDARSLGSLIGFVMHNNVVEIATIAKFYLVDKVSGITYRFLATYMAFTTCIYV